MARATGVPLRGGPRPGLEHWPPRTGELDAPARRVWVTCVRSRRPNVLCLLAFAPADSTCREVAQGDLRILALDGKDHALAVEDTRQIVRLDLRTGARKVLFPRGE